MIRIEGLTIRYGDLTAVEELSLHVPEGSFYGFLGPNGAGKTSTLSCVAGLRTPSGGSIRVAGHDVAAEAEAARRSLGLVPQSLALYAKLSVLQNLRFFGGLYGLSGKKLRGRVEWGLDLAQLTERAGDAVEALSGGMKRRLNLACGLLHDPPLILCDEPTTGVDPQSRNHIFETLRTLHGEGRTVVYTTHYMEEVEALCDRVAILDHGKLLANDRLDRLLAGKGSGPLRLHLPAGADIEALSAALRDAGIKARVEPEPRTLEDLFLDLTGRELRD